MQDTQVIVWRGKEYQVVEIEQRDHYEGETLLHVWIKDDE